MPIAMPDLGTRSTTARDTHGRQTLLMVLPRVPYPPHESGLGLRYFPVIAFLAQRHILDIMIVGDGVAEQAEPLRAYCRNLFIISNDRLEEHFWWEKWATWMDVLMPWTPPHYCLLHRSGRVSRDIRAQTQGMNYDTLLCVGVSWHTPHIQQISAKRVLIDFVDSLTRFYARNVGGATRSPFYRYEAWKARRYEIKLLRQVTAGIYISQVDAQTLSPQQTGHAVRYALPNGISVDTYLPARHGGVTSPSIGFLGNMGYFPNVEAALWLYEEVFCPLRLLLPALSLYVIGRDPNEAISALGKQEGVVVTGEVAQVWPHINAVDVFILPLWRGTGVKNKILEILYAKRAVLTTPLANEGIDAVSGRDLILCDTAPAFQKEALRLLQSAEGRAHLGESGHRWVTEHFSWDRILKGFEAVVTGASDASHYQVHHGPSA